MNFLARLCRRLRPAPRLAWDGLVTAETWGVTTVVGGVRYAAYRARHNLTPDGYWVDITIADAGRLIYRDYREGGILDAIEHAERLAARPAARFADLPATLADVPPGA